MALQYGTASTATITSAGTLASGSSASSAAITSDTTVNVTDYMISVEFAYTGAPTATTGAVNVYVYSSVDGTNYMGNAATSDNIDGTDKSVTLQSPTNLIPIGTIAAQVTSTTVKGKDMSLAQAFGNVPPKWGVVVTNSVGQAFTSCTVRYRSVYYS